MTTDFRALCAELVDCLEKADWPGQHKELFQFWADIARAALAEPEPEWPTDEEIMELMPQQMRDDLAAAARAMAGFNPDNIKAASVFRIILNRHSVDHARAILARWGRPAPQLAACPACEGQPALRNTPCAVCGTDRPAPQPVPVSDRLPGPGDCDADGECYWFDPEGSGAWYQDTYQGNYTHWLPAHALPLPS